MRYLKVERHTKAHSHRQERLINCAAFKGQHRAINAFNCFIETESSFVACITFLCNENAL